MTIRDIERWIHLGVLLPLVTLVLAVAVGLVQVHGGYYEIVAGCAILMCVSGLVALFNALRLFPAARGRERERVILCICVGALFGFGPLVLVADAYLTTRRLMGG